MHFNPRVKPFQKSLSVVSTSRLYKIRRGSFACLAVALYGTQAHARFADSVNNPYRTFKVDYNAGKFSYMPQPASPTLYGSIDVIHVLATTGILEVMGTYCMFLLCAIKELSVGYF